MATMKEVAEKAGVSIATVSRILSEDKTLVVTDETRQRIMSIAKDLNYTRRNKKSKNSVNQINSTYNFLIVQWYNEEEELEDVYYLSIRSGIEKELDNLSCSYSKCTLEKSSFDIRGTDGIIALGKFDATEIVYLQSFHLPILFVDYDATGYGENSIVVDFKQGVNQALDYLSSMGHEKIGILSGKEKTRLVNNDILDARLEAYETYMLKRHLYQKKFVLQADFTTNGGYNSMQQFLSTSMSVPTAFFVSSDAMAIGTMKAIQDSGLKVPDDISIIGFNDINVSKYVSPALSTVKVYTEWMGKLAVETICNLIESTPPVPKKIVVGTALIKRESTSIRKQIE